MTGVITMVLEAVNDYILQYTDVQQDNLFRGYQNRSALPQTQDYTMYWLGDNTRIGTNVDEYKDFEATIHALREYTVNIDFCGDDQSSIEKRATNLAVLGRSYISVNFFKTYGITFNYAEEVKYLPFVDETEQYVHRYRIVLHLSRWDNVIVPQQTAIVVEPHIENVDVHHEP